MKKYILFLCSILLLSSCDFFNNCNAKKYAELLIPLVNDLYDQYGRPFLDAQGNQIQDYNELYYNYRTGEMFTHGYPPQLGVAVGDILDIGTRVMNNWLDTECEKGKTSDMTYTKPVLSYDGAAGSQQVLLNPNITPQIEQNSKKGGFTYTTYRVAAPGYYRVDFNANYNQAEKEYFYDNNYYNGSNGGNQLGKKSNVSFEVAVGKNTNPNENVKLPVNIIHSSEIGQQFDWGTSMENYFNSPLAKFMNETNALYEFYHFKQMHPDQPFIINNK